LTITSSCWHIPASTTPPRCSQPKSAAETCPSASWAGPSVSARAYSITLSRSTASAATAFSSMADSTLFGLFWCDFSCLRRVRGVWKLLIGVSRPVVRLTGLSRRIIGVIGRGAWLGMKLRRRRRRRRWGQCMM